MDTEKEEISVSVSVTRTSYPLPNACLPVCLFGVGEVHGGDGCKIFQKDKLNLFI
jgi:hypothetical protein